jgi:hypothetical protein
MVGVQNRPRRIFLSSFVSLQKLFIWWADIRPFIADRGKSQSIFCDNGTNFVGAKHILDQQLRSLLQSKSHWIKIHQFTATEGIEWHFIPPRSPHFGGLGEAAVKSFKHHLL